MKGKKQNKAIKPREADQQITKVDKLNGGIIRKDISQLARHYANKALDCIVDALNATDFRGNPDYRTRVAAASIILDRGYGKAPQVVQHLDRIDDSTLEQAARQILLKRISASTDGGKLEQIQQGGGSNVPSNGSEIPTLDDDAT